MSSSKINAAVCMHPTAGVKLQFKNLRLDSRLRADAHPEMQRREPIPFVGTIAFLLSGPEVNKPGYYRSGEPGGESYPYGPFETKLAANYLQATPLMRTLASFIEPQTMAHCMVDIWARMPKNEFHNDKQASPAFYGTGLIFNEAMLYLDRHFEELNARTGFVASKARLINKDGLPAVKQPSIVSKKGSAVEANRNLWNEFQQLKLSFFMRQNFGATEAFEQCLRVLFGSEAMDSFIDFCRQNGIGTSRELFKYN